MTNEQIIKEFREIIGKVPENALHEQTGACIMCGQPWEKGEQVKKLESFILQVRTEAYQEGQEDAFKGKVQNLKTLTITETVNVIPELQEYFKKRGRQDTINEIRKEVEKIKMERFEPGDSDWIRGYNQAFVENNEVLEDIKTFLDKLDSN